MELLIAINEWYQANFLWLMAVAGWLMAILALLSSIRSTRRARALRLRLEQGQASTQLNCPYHHPRLDVSQTR